MVLFMLLCVVSTQQQDDEHSHAVTVGQNAGPRSLLIADLYGEQQLHEAADIVHNRQQLADECQAIVMHDEYGYEKPLVLSPR